MRYLALFLMFCFVATSVKAQDAASDVRHDAFGLPEQPVKVIEAAAQAAEPASANVFPSCEDEVLLAEVRRVLVVDESKLEEESVVARRSRLLALKNISKFAPVDVASFKPDDSYEVANLLITAKVNNGLNNSDFRICASDNPVLKRRVYLLLRQSAEGVMVDVVNYRPGAIPSFVYKK